VCPKHYPPYPRSIPVPRGPPSPPLPGEARGVFFLPGRLRAAARDGFPRTRGEGEGYGRERKAGPLYTPSIPGTTQSLPYPQPRAYRPRMDPGPWRVPGISHQYCILGCPPAGGRGGILCLIPIPPYSPPPGLGTLTRSSGVPPALPGPVPYYPYGRGPCGAQGDIPDTGRWRGG
jgi:hypothetical protein